MAMLALLGALTFEQGRMYADPKTLYRTTIERNPDDWMAHQNLGLIYARGPVHRAEAIAEFEQVIRLKPDHNRAHYNLGVALYLSGRGTEAIDHFEKAIQFAPGNALIVGLSHYFLGVILTPMPGRRDDAIAHLREAISMRPADTEARAALASALAARPPAKPR